MSYSFSVRGANKADAISKVAAELTKVVSQQPVHAADRAQAGAAAEAFVNVLADDPVRDVGVSVTGSIFNTEDGVQESSCSVSAKLVDKKAA